MDEDVKNEIIRRFYRGQSIRGIGRELRVCRKTIRRVLDEHERDRQTGAAHGDLPAPGRRRGSQLDAFEQTILEYLERYPNITAVRLQEELQRQGYTGGYTILRERLRELRPRLERPRVQRFETSPGVQAQMDYAVYTIEFTQEGRRKVNLFSYILGYSRRQYLRFVPAQDFETTVREHIRAFEHLGGVAATCLYDNMKVVVSRYDDGQPIYNPRFLGFATHYGFRPVACRPRRPQTKGKIERPFFYVETNLLVGRTFRSLEHLNDVAAWWLAEVADQRIHRHTRERPLDRHAAEQPHLIPLPASPYEVAEVVYRTVDVEGFVSYGQNRYQVPWQKTHPGQVLPVKITDEEVIIYGPAIEEIARHPRFPPHVTYQKREHKDHQPPRDLARRRECLKQRFAELGETAVEFLDGLLAANRNGWSQAQSVLALLGNYRRDDLRAALERAVRYGAYSLSAVERILAVKAQPKTALDQLAEEAGRHLSPHLTDDSAPPRPTSAYQHLLFEDPPDDATPAETDKSLHNQDEGQPDEEPDEARPEPGGSA